MKHSPAYIGCVLIALVVGCGGGTTATDRSSAEPAPPEAPAQTAQVAADAAAQVRQIEDQIGVSIVRRDTSFVDRTYADEFFYTGVRGEIQDKAKLIAGIEASTWTFDVLEFDDVEVRVYGDTAVATGRAVTKGHGPSGEITGEFRYTRVYVKRDGRWLVVNFQATPIQR